MRVDQLRKLIVGTVITVPTPFDDEFEMDLGRMADATQFWVENGLVAGVAVIKVAAAMGEGPLLRDWEWPVLLRTVAQAANGKAAIVCGIQYKDTLRAVEDAKRAQDLGAIGLQVAPPLHNSPTQDDTLRYFEAISKAVEIGIVVYDQPWEAYGNIEIDTILKMRDFEHVVAIKWHGDPKPYDDMRRLVPYFNVVDNSPNVVRCHQMGGRGFISTSGMAYPAFDLKLWGLMEARRYEEAQALFESVFKPLQAFAGKLYQTSGGQARLTKGLMQIMGHPMGASRPPSLPLSAAELDELRALVISFGWPVPR